jgi:dCTP deaminase
MILNDSDIVAQIGKGLIPSGLTQPVNWYAKDSPVQPASLDLSVGRVFPPCKEDQNKPHPPEGETQYILKPGRTAIVLTREELKMPGDLIAIGFPPSSVSVKGILMTNPGQVDPGYEGRLRFTVINMGRKDFVLREGDIIVSLIVMKMANSAQANWLTRHSGKPGGPVTWKDLNRISSDFLDVDARTSKIAKEEVDKADVKIKRLQTWVPIGGILVLILNGLFSLVQASWKEPLQKVQQDVAVLKSEKNVDQLSKQVQELQAQIKTLQQKMPANPSPSKP